jgi:hypothetical protein
MRSMQSTAPQGRRANVAATVLDERVARGRARRGRWWRRPRSPSWWRSRSRQDHVRTLAEFRESWRRAERSRDEAEWSSSTKWR